MVLQRIRGNAPPRGTGPLGAPGGARWASVADVLAWNAKVYTERDEDTWNAADDERLCVRSFGTEEIPLRDYQAEACGACTEGYADVFHSGCVVMGCGDGKSRVAAELIRRSRAPAVILAPHKLSIEQWVELIRTYVTPNVVTLNAVRDNWKCHMPVPDVLVTTYHSLVRVTKHAMEVRNLLSGPSSAVGAEEHHEDRLLMMLMCERFGVLVMDEVHMAVADYFISAGLLRCSVVYGLSGSLVREDDRIGRLICNVGPALYTRFTRRNLTVTIITVPMSEEHTRRLLQLRKRSKWEQTFRALNPYKMFALDGVLRRHAEERVIVFCDVTRAADIVHATYPGSILMTGRDDAEAREVALSRFNASPKGLLVCTRICDASINFPPRCIVVQHHVSNASRQQEVQRCGRGTRDISSDMSYMYHLVNADSEEVGYVERRVHHLSTFMTDGLTIDRETVSGDAPLAEAHLLARESSLVLAVRRVQAPSSTTCGAQGQIEKMIRNQKRRHG